MPQVLFKMRVFFNTINIYISKKLIWRFRKEGFGGLKIPLFHLLFSVFPLLLFSIYPPVLVFFSVPLCLQVQPVIRQIIWNKHHLILICQINITDDPGSGMSGIWAVKSGAVGPFDYMDIATPCIFMPILGTCYFAFQHNLGTFCRCKWSTCRNFWRLQI
jgi:hypothetical protein